MQIRIKITANDIRIALDRQSKGFTMESPVTVFLERSGYKGAVHSPDRSHQGSWCYDPTGANYLKIHHSKRLHKMLTVWWRTQVCIPNTYIVQASQILEEPHFPGYSQEGTDQK